MKLFKNNRNGKFPFNNKGFVATSIAVGTAIGIGGAGLAAGLGGAAVLGAAAFGVGSLLTGGGKSSVQAPAALPAAPSQQQAETQSRGKAVEEQRTKLRGSRTTKTSPQGLLSLKETTGKTLLGGG